MNVEPRKIVTLDGATVTLTQTEVRQLKAELECVLRSAKFHEVKARDNFDSKYNNLIFLKGLLEEKCTL